MKYVALLRGINVGGKAKVEMSRLKATFERLGLEDVKTYINSGNVIFESEDRALVEKIEQAIEKEFGLNVKVVLRDQVAIKAVVEALPENWTNDQVMKCDVMFVWESVDSPKVLEQLQWNPKIEDVLYVPGAIIWRVARSYQAKSKLSKIVSTPLYQQLTIRNCSTVRKLYELMGTI